MADTDSDAFAASDSHSYFVPMVDMLAGVVFILVILLAASMLVTRNDFAKAQKMQVETAKIKAELKQAEKEKRLYLDPRRRAELATRVLLKRLAASLTQQGYEVETSIPDGRITITGADAFDTAGPALTVAGRRLANNLGMLLAQQLPCLAGQRAGLAQCNGYPGIRLQTVQVSVPITQVPGKMDLDPALADARSLALMSGMVGGQPHLMALHAPGGAGIFTYISGSAQKEPGSASKALSLEFQMAVPPIPRQKRR